MNMKLVLRGDLTLDLVAREVTRVSAYERALQFISLVELTAAQRAELANLVCGAAPITLQIVVGDAVLVPQLQLVGLREVPRLGAPIEIVAEPLRAAESARALADRPKTATELLKSLEDVLAAPAEIKNALAPVKCPLGDKTCWIQYRLTTARRIGAALGAIATLKDDPLTKLATASAAGGSPALQAVWHTRSAYAQVNALDPHVAKFDANDGCDSVTFDTISGAPVAVRHRHNRKFTHAEFTKSAATPWPFVRPTGPATSAEVRERLHVTDSGGTGWITSISWGHHTPPPTPEPTVWLGEGAVEKWDAPWLKVKLTGFVPGRDIAFAKLLTPSSGTGGKTGLSLVPKPKTRVALAWSGRISDPLVCLGNRRDDAPEHPDSFLVTEDLLRVQVPDVRVAVEHLFEVLANAIKLGAKDTLTGNADGAIELIGGGGKLTLKNQKVHAGNG